MVLRLRRRGGQVLRGSSGSGMRRKSSRFFESLLRPGFFGTILLFYKPSEPDVYVIGEQSTLT